MDDLRTRFLSLDRASVPDLWLEIERRAESATISSRAAQATVRAGRSIDGRGAGTRRSPLGGLVWVALLGLLLVVALAIGGLAVGAWKLDDLRVVVPPSASPTEFACPSRPADQPLPELELDLQDETGMVTGCQQVSGTLFGTLGPSRPMEITNPDGDLRRLEVKWAVTSCDLGATLRLTSVDGEYQMHVEDRQEPPCVPGTALTAVQLELREDVLASAVIGAIDRVQAPNGQ